MIIYDLYRLMSDAFPVIENEFVRPDQWDEQRHIAVRIRGRIFFIDREYFPFLSGTRCYINPGGYLQFHINRKTVLYHRFVMSEPDKYMVNHDNGNRSDNRRCNLSVVTAHENAAFRASKRGKQQSGVRLKNSKWEAAINFNFQYRYLGAFDSEHDARVAYDLEAVKIFGAYATTNYPIENYTIPEIPESRTITLRSFKKGSGTSTQCKWVFGCSVRLRGKDYCAAHEVRTEQREKRVERGERLRQKNIKASHCLDASHLDQKVKVFSGGLCHYHYRKKREAEGYKKPKKKYFCSIPGCTSQAVKIKARLCLRHANPPKIKNRKNPPCPHPGCTSAVARLGYCYRHRAMALPKLRLVGAGDALKALRVQHGISQSQCSRLMGMSESGCAGIEFGKTMSIECARKLCESLGIEYEKHFKQFEVNVRE